MNNDMVAHAWAHGREGKGSNFYSDGRKLLSYSTTVAIQIDGVFYISADNMSPTTGKQLSYAKRAVSYNYFSTHAFSYGRRLEWPSMATHEDLIKPEAEHVLRELEIDLANSKTRKSTKLKALAHYAAERERILTHCATVGVSFKMPEFKVDDDTITKYHEAAKAKAAKEERARIKRQKEQQKADKLQYEAWITTGAGRCPQSFITRGADQFTIKHRIDGELYIVTSQGAECPLDHAVKAIKFYLSRRRIDYRTCSLDINKQKGCTYEPYHTNGHKIPLGIFTLDAIDEHGNVKAGCHTFRAAEIQRFINQWREVLGL